MRIAFIGAGNMASSLIQGLLTQGFDARDIIAADPDAGRRASVARHGVAATADNADAIRDAQAVVLAVKPQVIRDVVSALRFRVEQLLISIAAGVPAASLARWTQPEQPIVRCMPNTPALVGAGITGLFATNSVSEAQRQQAEHLLGAVGTTLWVAEEALLDAVTAVSGSGPAYFFYLMQAMIEAGQALGLDRATAAKLTVETAYGSALMARDGKTPPDVLRANVTSPGGTTERAISLMDADDCAGIIRKALHGARERSAELAREFGE